MSVENTEAKAVASINKIELQDLETDAKYGDNLLSRNMDLIRGVKVKLSASLGKRELTVQELFQLKEGEVLQLDKLTTDPVDILLDGRLVARGELVVVDDNFGVRITELAQHSAA